MPEVIFYILHHVSRKRKLICGREVRAKRNGLMRLRRADAEIAESRSERDWMETG